MPSNEITIRSSAAEYLTYIAATGDNPQSFRICNPKSLNISICNAKQKRQKEGTAGVLRFCFAQKQKNLPYKVNFWKTFVSLRR